MKRILFTLIVALVACGVAFSQTVGKLQDHRLSQTITASKSPSPAISPGTPRVILVLGSGGARGLAHVGVLQVLEQAKIPIDMIVGTSAGSIAGALYADQGNAASVRNLFVDAKRKDFVDFSLLHILNGPITGKALEQFLSTNMEAREFSGLKIPFVAVATDLEKGVAYPISSGPIATAVHASVAMPLYFHSVQLDGRTLVDGGVTAPLAVSIARTYQPDVVIAVSVSGSLRSKLPGNSLGEVARSYSITLATLEDGSKSSADVVVTPDIGTSGTFNFNDKEFLFDAGAKAATEALPQIKKILAEKGIALSPAR